MAPTDEPPAPADRSPEPPSPEDPAAAAKAAVEAREQRIQAILCQQEELRRQYNALQQELEWLQQQAGGGGAPELAGLVAENEIPGEWGPDSGADAEAGLHCARAGDLNGLRVVD